MELIASGRDSYVFAHAGYPVPVVHDATGPDIVMEPVDGPTLHVLGWPGAAPDQALLHLDLHPL
jgi:hypothetical protein